MYFSQATNTMPTRNSVGILAKPDQYQKPEDRKSTANELDFEIQRNRKLLSQEKEKKPENRK
ncbi:hypothetical protein [Pseudogemmobacter sonorensis]|uniref:hypothetical protein n=1 Tax=Pseudogemmobacter sonorensis TaxID=2989681 RepID=UPI0036BD0A13